MAFCSNCGKELVSGAKFCFECGTPVGKVEDTTRRTVYSGEIHKCPSCGEVLGAFVSVCPSCGHELRGTQSASSIKDFLSKMENSTTDEQRVILIRNFPIPNTKEDILEFMILASTNISKEQRKNIFDAWTVKFAQCYEKTKLIFSNEKDFDKFQSIYEQTNKHIISFRLKRTLKKALSIVRESASILPQIIVSIGWIISIFILIVLCGDGDEFNAYQMVIWLDFIAGAIFLPSILRCKSTIPKLIAVIGLMISIVVLVFRCGDGDEFNAYQLILIIDIVSSIVIFIRTFKKK